MSPQHLVVGTPVVWLNRKDIGSHSDKEVVPTENRGDHRGNYLIYSNNNNRLQRFFGVSLNTPQGPRDWSRRTLHVGRG